MEAVWDALSTLVLNNPQVMFAGFLLFVLGFYLGSIKTRRLNQEKHGLEKAIMELNEELLYGTVQPEIPERHTPVIDLKQKSFKAPQIAK